MRSSGYQNSLDKLAHATWAPSDKRYLLAVSTRLLEMSTYEPEILNLIGLTASELSSLPGQIEIAAKQSPPLHAELKTISKNPAPTKHLDNKHPLFGLLTLMPSYALFITKLPNESSLNDAFEQILSSVFLLIIKANLASSFESYQQSCNEIFKRELDDNYDLDETYLPPLHHELNQLSLNARKAVSHLSSSLTTPLSPSEQKIWGRFEGSSKRFLANPARTKRRSKPRKSSGKPIQRRSAFRSDASATHLQSPLLLDEIEAISAWEELEPDSSSHLIKPEQRIFAEKEDLCEFELIEEDDWEIGQELNEFSTPASARVSGKYQAKQCSNAAQLLRWSTSNLTPSAKEQMLSSLIELALPHTAHGLAASLILASVVTGRPLEQLYPNGLRLTDSPDIPKTLNNSVQTIFFPRLNAIALRVNKPNVKNITDWNGAHSASDFIWVTDYLRVGEKLSRMKGAIPEVGNTSVANKGNKLIINATGALLAQLSSEGANASKVWQTLPRLMQSESGMFTGMAMLTDWSTANSRVDLHYHTVPATLLSKRYSAAMSHITDINSTECIKLEREIPRQHEYVGAPNCPTNVAIEALIQQFEKAFKKFNNDVISTHNLTCLYTLMFCTAGFGLRHAINPEFSVTRYKSMAWVSYVEKGQLRQLLLPSVVNQQLQHFDAHLMRMKSRPLVKSLLSEGKRFFLLDERNAAQQKKLEPSKIGELLKVFNIDFPLPLNTLRRWMFSQQFIAGGRGIGTDFFGGHGVQGRLPLTATSSTTVDVYQESAQEMSEILVDAGWRMM